MKKHILLSALAAGLIFIAPAKAIAATVNKQPHFISSPEENTEKAKTLSDKAFWMIFVNSANSDSLQLAISLCNQAIELDPEFVDAYSNRADANSYLKNYDEALKDLNYVVDKRGDARDFQYRGECKFHSGNTAGALEDYKTAFDKGYSNTIICNYIANGDANELGVAFYNAGDYTDAITAFNISVLSMKTETNTFNRGNAEYMAGDHQSALVDWKQSGKLGNKEGKKSYRKFKKEK